MLAVLETMNQNLTFQHDPYSRKATRYFLWLYAASLLLVVGLIALQYHIIAFGVLFLTLVMTGMLLRRLHGRYQTLDLVKEKRHLQQEVSRLQEKLIVVQKSLTETRERREHLLRKEQFGLEATLRNQQLHHIDKGLSSYFVRDESLSGLVPELKEQLEKEGILTALDISDEAISRIAGVDPASREALVQWRVSLYEQFDATKPVKLPDHQLNYIQKKFNRLHARNDEKEQSLTQILQQFEGELHAVQQRLKQLAPITFRGYLLHTLMLK
jgi:DNA-binding helix-hairpin-helix protein with protein kinase domain